MINTQPLNINQLTRIYLMANTPSYLFRHYKKDPTVQDFAKANAIVELVSLIVEVANIDVDKRTLEQVVVAYASAVALTFKRFQEVKIAIANKSFNSLVWIEKIFHLWDDSRVATQVMNITFPPTIQKQKSMSNSNNLFISKEVSV